MPYRFGIVGAGFISDRFAGVLRQNPRAEIVAVTDVIDEKAEAFAQRHHIPQAADAASFWDLEMDAVYIGLPNNAHVPAVRNALAHGLHVLCEKPMTMTEREAVQLFEEAKKADRLLMEGMWSRCLPVYQTVRQWIEQGRIGTVRLIDSSFSGRVPFDPENRLFSRALGGGSMFDVGVYSVEFATGLLGEPISVSGEAHVGTTGVDEQAVILLRFPNGAMAYSSCGFQAQTPSDARIYGTKGSIYVKDFYKSDLCILYDDVGAEADRFTDSFADGFSYEIDHVLDLLDAGKRESDIVPGKDTILSGRIYDILRDRWNTL